PECRIQQKLMPGICKEFSLQVEVVTPVTLNEFPSHRILVGTSEEGDAILISSLFVRAQVNGITVEGKCLRGKRVRCLMPHIISLEGITKAHAPVAKLAELFAQIKIRSEKIALRQFCIEVGKGDIIIKLPSTKIEKVRERILKS